MRLYSVVILWQKREPIYNGTNISTSISNWIVWDKSEGDAFMKVYDKLKTKYKDYGMDEKMVIDITDTAKKGLNSGQNVERSVATEADQGGEAGKQNNH